MQISPEKPIPLLCCGVSPALQRNLQFNDWESDSDVVRTRNVEWTAGGKATNAARAIRNAKGLATLLGFSGGPNGQRMEQLIKQEKLPAIWVPVKSETRICQSLLDADGKRIRELVEEAGPIGTEEWDRLLEKVKQELTTHAALLLCGSLPLDAPPALYASLAKIAEHLNRPVILDTTGDILKQTFPHKPYLVKINRSELLQTTGQSDIPDGLDILMSEGVQIALITDGPHQAWLGYDTKRVRFTLPTIDVINPIGGGDTVTGVTALELYKGKNPTEASKAGLAAGLAQTMRSKPADFDLETANQLAAQIEIQS